MITDVFRENPEIFDVVADLIALCFYACAFAVVAMQKRDHHREMKRSFLWFITCNTLAVSANFYARIIAHNSSLRGWFSAAIYFSCGMTLLGGVGVSAFVFMMVEDKLRINLVFLRFIQLGYVLPTVALLIPAVRRHTYVITPDAVAVKGSWFFLWNGLVILLGLLCCIYLFYHIIEIGPRDALTFGLYFSMPGLLAALRIAYAPQLFIVFNAVAILYLYIITYQESLRRLKLKDRRQQRELDELRTKIMLSQIRPHFLYNALSAIARLCRIDPEAAYQTTNTFAKYLRENMSTIDSLEPIPFERELLHTENYLLIEKVRFRDRLHVVYHVIDTDFCLPVLTLEPLVENAVKHGVCRREEGGTVTISAVKTETDYVVTVTDDGVGCTPADLSRQDDRDHVGIANVRERLAQQMGARLDIASTPGIGTTAVITIPKEGA